MNSACAALLGAVIWLGLAAASGRAEAWDSPLYLVLGMPLLGLTAGAFGALAPGPAWRYGGWLMVGQALALLLMSGPGNLLPLGMILFALLALPLMLVAGLGAWLARRFAGP